MEISTGTLLIQAKKGAGAQCNIKELLEQLLLIPDVKEALQANGNKINLRFAANGRRTSNKTSTVMDVTISTLSLYIMVKTYL